MTAQSMTLTFKTPDCPLGTVIREEHAVATGDVVKWYLIDGYRRKEAEAASSLLRGVYYTLPPESTVWVDAPSIGRDLTRSKAWPDRFLDEVISADTKILMLDQLDLLPGARTSDMIRWKYMRPILAETYNRGITVIASASGSKSWDWCVDGEITEIFGGRNGELRVGVTILDGPKASVVHKPHDGFCWLNEATVWEHFRGRSARPSKGEQTE